MPIFRRQQTTDGRGSVLVAELTTGQAVMFLCAALVLLGAAFVTGRLVARVDRPIGAAAEAPGLEAAKAEDHPGETTAIPSKEAITQNDQVQTGPTQTYTIPAMQAGAGKPAPTATPAPAATAAAAAAPPPTTVSAAPATTAPATVEAAPATTAATASTPAPVVVAEAVPAAAPVAPPQPTQIIQAPPVSQPSAAPKTSPLIASTKQRLTDLPPLPSNQEAPAPAPVEKPAPVPEAPPPVQTAAAAPAAQPQIVPVDPPPTEAPSAITAPAAPGPKSEPSVAMAPPVPTAAPEPKPQPAAAPADKPAATAKSGTFAVQLGSFEGAQRQTKAQSLQKRIKKDYGLNAQIVNSEKEMLSRVVLTGYADKNSASAACAELRKKSGLSGAFVRAL